MIKTVKERGFYVPPTIERHVAAMEERIEQLEKLGGAVWNLDLTDEYTVEQADPGELISCTRPVELWIELRTALASTIAGDDDEPPELDFGKMVGS